MATATKTSLENIYLGKVTIFFLASFVVDRARCKWTGRSAAEVNIENERFTVVCSRLSLKPYIWKFHVVIWQTTSKNSTKVRAARAARLFFVIQPIRSLFSGVVVAVAVVVA